MQTYRAVVTRERMRARSLANKGAGAGLRSYKEAESEVKNINHWLNFIIHLSFNNYEPHSTLQSQALSCSQQSIRIAGKIAAVFPFLRLPSNDGSIGNLCTPSEHIHNDATVRFADKCFFCW